MCKNMSKYKIVYQEAKWNPNHINVRSYEKKMTEIVAKSGKKAVESFKEVHAILQVRKIK